MQLVAAIGDNRLWPHIRPGHAYLRLLGRTAIIRHIHAAVIVIQPAPVRPHNRDGNRLIAAKNIDRQTIDSCAQHHSRPVRQGVGVIAATVSQCRSGGTFRREGRARLGKDLSAAHEVDSILRPDLLDGGPDAVAPVIAGEYLRIAQPTSTRLPNRNGRNSGLQQAGGQVHAIIVKGRVDQRKGITLIGRGLGLHSLCSKKAGGDCSHQTGQAWHRSKRGKRPCEKSRSKQPHSRNPRFKSENKSNLKLNRRTHARAPRHKKTGAR